MKKTAYIIIFIFITLNLFAQKTENIKIKWLLPVTEKVDGNTLKYLYFENAVFANAEQKIPEFQKLIKFENNFEVENVKLNNIKYQALTPSEQKIINTQNIKPLKINYHTAKSGKEYLLIISFTPVVKTPSGEIKKITDFSLSYKTNNVAGKNLRSNNYKTESVLATGKWLKIAVSKNNAYKLTYDTLSYYGLASKEGVKIYTAYNGLLPEVFDTITTDDLKEIPVEIHKGADGIFNSGDYILFYGQSPETWQADLTNNIFKYKPHIYSNKNYYYITTGSPKTIETQQSLDPSTANTVINKYNYYTVHEKNLTNLIHSGKLFLGEHFTTLHTSENILFEVPNIVQGSNVHLSGQLVSRSTRTSYFKLTYGSSNTSLSFTPISISGYVYAKLNSFDWSFNTSNSPININILYQYSDYDAGSEGWLDYIQLNAESKIKYTGTSFNFRSLANVGTGNISTYQVESANQNLKIWDVTDIFNTSEINFTINGSYLQFTRSDEHLHEYFVFNDDNISTPEFIGNVQNQNLHQAENYDMIIISHPNFLPYAEELANIHRNNDNLSVKVVTQEQIFNEFSGGKPDIAAIRNYLKMYYDRSMGTYPKYALLFGDGSFDNVTPISNGNTNFILTYQSNESLSKTSSYVSDDYYALLDNNEQISGGYCDLGIGRIPVDNTTQAAQVMAKIKQYINPSSFGSWRNNLTFLADDEDGNLHMKQADSLTSIILQNEPLYNINKIYLDAYEQISTPSGERYPDVNRAISDAMSAGNMIFNYTGHGNELGLAHERILSINEINAWSNFTRLPLFITATCEFSRWDDFTRTTAGEFVFLNPKGGAIAMLTTTRLVYASQNFILNKAFYNYAFGNENYRFGDLIRVTKQYSGNSTNKRNFSLLGDPALKLPYANYNVVTTSIKNSQQTENDTLKALEMITISGKVIDDANNDVDYNGVVYPVIFDKFKQITTLGNGGTNPFTFKIQKNILFKGKATVQDGKFSFSFIVPKDIAYNYGFGKISYYAQNNEKDASGYKSDIIIGGSSNNIGSDKKGPDIDLYLNDNNFVYGGLTNSTPLLLANLYDQSGINTVGNGIGHDISAIIDKNTANSINLNEFYESETDDFKKGSVKYKLSKLSPGTHSLSLKAWDVYNNSSESYIEFVVAENEHLALDHIFNYPNPFTTNTDFYFDHNMPGVTLNVRINIFTISGKLVKTLEKQMNTAGFRSEPINWNGKDEFGDQLAKGVYIYKISVKTSSGENIQKYEKLVILK